MKAGVQVHTPILITLLVANGCAPPQRNVRFTEHAGGTVTSFSTPADLRLAFLRSDDAKQTYCAEPMPDVALGSEASGSANIGTTAAFDQAVSSNQSLSMENERLRDELRKAVDKYEEQTKQTYKTSLDTDSSSSIKNGGSSSFNLAAAARLAVTVSELGGRSATVVLAREFLYRLCEARANGFFHSEAQYVELQTNALKMIQNIAVAQRTSSEAEIVAANAQLVKDVLAYNVQEEQRCDSQQKLCVELAAKDDAKKSACLSKRETCAKPLDAQKLTGSAGAGPVQRTNAIEPLNLTH